MHDRRFAGRTALVTGAGSGFGRATALGLARGGAATVGLLERDPDRLGQVAADVEALGARPVSLAVDLRRPEDVPAAVAAVVEAGGGQLDILVSNHAAMAHAVDFLDGTDDDWRLRLDVDLTSHYALAREAARAMGTPATAARSPSPRRSTPSAPGAASRRTAPPRPASWP